MHYREYDPGSINKSVPAIVAKNPIYIHTIGTYRNASKLDYQKVCRAYGCDCQNDFLQFHKVVSYFQRMY